MTLFIGSLQLGLLYGVMVLGIYISFRILNIPDLTAEGSFTLGLAVSAACTLSGHPFLGLLAAMAAGSLAGSFTGFLHTCLGIHPVLTGILTMSGLYSVNMLVLGGTPNLALMGRDTLFSLAVSAGAGLDKEMTRLCVALAAAGLSAAVLAWFFRTRLGLYIRATGDNGDMVRASSIHEKRMKLIALALSNGLTALCGGLIAQYQSFADISSGVGTLVVGLASVIIGEALLGRRSVTLGLCSSILGSVVYRYIIAVATRADWFPAYMLKLVSALIVTLALALPALGTMTETYRIRRQGRTAVRISGTEIETAQRPYGPGAGRRGRHNGIHA